MLGRGMVESGSRETERSLPELSSVFCVSGSTIWNSLPESHTVGLHGAVDYTIATEQPTAPLIVLHIATCCNHTTHVSPTATSAFNRLGQQYW